MQNNGVAEVPSLEVALKMSVMPAPAKKAKYATDLAAKPVPITLRCAVARGSIEDVDVPGGAQGTCCSENDG
jgi:hypothetical protein